MKRSIFVLVSLAVLAAVTALVFGTLGEGGGKVQGAPGTITAEASGSVTPTPGSCPLTNGDFEISLFDSNEPPCGDGDNELTTWTFDFCFPANIEALTSALLTLELTPLGDIFSTDSVGISGLGGLPADPIPGNTDVETLYNAAPGGLTRTIQVELLNPPGPGKVDPNGFRDFFNANAGQIPMRYQDDAIISFAKLELEPASCAVGGITDLLVGSGDSPASPADGSGSSVPLYAALAGAAVVAFAASGWYVRRRWLS